MADVSTDTVRLRKRELQLRQRLHEQTKEISQRAKHATEVYTRAVSLQDIAEKKRKESGDTLELKEMRATRSASMFTKQKRILKHEENSVRETTGKQRVKAIHEKEEEFENTRRNHARALESMHLHQMC